MAGGDGKEGWVVGLYVSSNENSIVSQLENQESYCAIALDEDRADFGSREVVDVSWCRFPLCRPREARRLHKQHINATRMSMMLCLVSKLCS